MQILAALVALSVAAGVRPTEQVTCDYPIHCPCGSTGRSVKVCPQEVEGKGDPCSLWSKCKTCQDGLDGCLECPVGLEGQLCSTATRRKKLSRQKRQYYNHPPYHQTRPRRPVNSNYQQTPNQRGPSYPTGPQQRQQGVGSCPELRSPKLGSIRCIFNDRQKTCVGRCLPGYKFEGRGSEVELTLTCTGGYYTPFNEFPPCKSGGYCDLTVVGSGSFNCTTGMRGTLCDIICDGRFQGHYFCNPGHPWEPHLPHCMEPKEVDDVREACNCEYGGSCDIHGNCVCPDGRTGRFCEKIPVTQTCSDPGFVKNGLRKNPYQSDSSVRRTFTEGESVVYSCISEEYALQGSPLLSCKNDGMWSSPLPKCIRTPSVRPQTGLLHCPDPGVDPNGSRNPQTPPSRQGFPQGSSLEYSCNEGYDLNGEKNVFCVISGKWSSARPTCKPRATESPETALAYCRDPGMDPNGSRKPQSPTIRRGFPQGSSLVYSCNLGYDLNGERTVYCLASGKWSSARPTCKPQSREPAIEPEYCLNPGPISNGRVVYYPPLNSRRGGQPQSSPDEEEYPYGGRLEYSCDSGYNLDGYLSLICGKNGEWSEQPPVCTKEVDRVYCLNPGSSISNGRVVYYPPLSSRRRVQHQTTLDDPEYPLGARLEYSCDSGYTLRGYLNLTCEEDGEWSTEPPVCEEKTREKLSRQKRQYYNYSPYQQTRPRGPVNSPYQQSPNQRGPSYPTGPSRQQQQGSGSCPALSSPKLGSIRCIFNDRQKTCVGTCLPGYTFEGHGSEDEMTLTCTGDYYTPFNEFPPCKSGGYCDLTVVGSGSFNCTTGMRGTRCDIICNGRFVGRYFCYPGHHWEPHLPHCMKPKDVEDIHEACNCEYGGSCDIHGKCVCPVGRTGRFCEKIPVMQTCSDPGFVKNGLRKNPDESDSTIRRTFTEGESVVYSCISEEYALQGSPLLNCKNDGKWSSPLPKCIRTPSVRPVTGLLHCLDPGVDPNGSRKPQSPPSRQGFPQGTSLEYSCNQGYDLNGEKNVFCVISGKWSAARPTCKPRATESPRTAMAYCRDPGMDPNGSRKPQSPATRRGFPQGSSLVYSCNQGYDLNGERTVYCLASGKWSSARPTCKPQSREPAIEPVYCLNPGPISNGRVMYYPPLNSRRGGQPQTTPDEEEYPVGGRLEYSCDSGYSLDGYLSLVCGKNGEWSEQPPVCTKDVDRVYCLNPGASISNGRVAYYPPLISRRRVEPQTTLDDPEYPLGARLQYSCYSGYTLRGYSNLTCEEDGEWSTEPPVCEKEVKIRLSLEVKIRYCDNLGPIPNGRVVHVSAQNARRPRPPDDNEEFVEYPQGSRLTYFCNNGYSLQGESNLTCEASGEWSAEPPTCITSDIKNMLYCVNPGPLLNGKIRYYSPMARPRTGSTTLVSEDTPEYPEGTRLEYECDEGYNTEGSFSLTCESTGMWSDLPPKCVSDCGRSVMGTTRRILHGNKTEIGEWPWVVAIGVRENDFMRLICGGAVLNTRTVITAAHCLTRGNRFVLFFGKYHQSNRLDDEQVLIRASDRVIIHPDYNNVTQDSDIALITFKPKIKYSQRVQPICLPSAESTAKNLVTGKKGYVTGWGYTEKRRGSDDLLMAHLPFLTNSACLQSFRENVPNFNPVLTQNMFCAGYPEGNQTTCRGDSGSALVYYDRMTERHTLEGLVSFGVEGQCGLPGRYSVFTKVYRYLPWIYRNM